MNLFWLAGWRGPVRFFLSKRSVRLTESFDRLPSHREQLRPAHQLVLRALATRAPPVRADAGIKPPAVRAIECQNFFLRRNAPLAITFERFVTPRVGDAGTETAQTGRHRDRAGLGMVKALAWSATRPCARIAGNQLASIGSSKPPGA